MGRRNVNDRQAHADIETNDVAMGKGARHHLRTAEYCAAEVVALEIVRVASPSIRPRWCAMR
jgi:hypothetical protein